MALSFIPGQHLPAPGYCISCGNNGVDCIDSGSSKDFYGALLLCLDCFRDGALRISELDLFDKTLHNNMIAELEEKIEWRKSFEPTIAKLELDLDTAMRGARRGFSQRYVADNSFDEIQPRIETDPRDRITDGSGFARDDNQLFFSLEELRDIVDDSGQVNNNVGNEGTAGISSSSSYAD